MPGAGDNPGGGGEEASHPEVEDVEDEAEKQVSRNRWPLSNMYVLVVLNEILTRLIHQVHAIIIYNERRPECL